MTDEQIEKMVKEITEKTAKRVVDEAEGRVLLYIGQNTILLWKKIFNKILWIVTLMFIIVIAIIWDWLGMRGLTLTSEDVTLLMEALTPQK